ncbi:MAG: Alkaline phosphatase synthesis transcriptional regulatory protein PhoP [Elusimicrobia bacterium]|nr:Alkaline phosphatase synthesis transcriptional regulatory protein PhoP [Elusimicrobiota bacterium]
MIVNKRVFILEDEVDLVRLTTDLLESDGFVVNSAIHPVDGLQKLRINPPDLLLLDIRLPEIDGYQVCRELKKDPKTNHVPVIMISSKDEETDVVVGLEVGADDYICKPFRQKELLARVRAVLRRHETDLEPKDLVTGPLSLNCHCYSAAINRKDIHVTMREFELLRYLVSFEGRVLTRSRIYEQVWGVDFSGTSRTIDVHIDQLRKKLGKYAHWITTLKGIGYRFQVE